MVKTRTSNQFSNACIIKNFDITLMNKKTKKSLVLDNRFVTDIEIAFTDFKIMSYITLNDKIDVRFQLDDSQNLVFTSFLLDLVEGYYRRGFQVLSNTREQNASKKATTLIAQDEISYILDRLFISKTFKNMKLSDIFQNIFDTYVRNELSYNKITLELKSNIIIENFVITSTKSVLKTLQEEAERQGLYFSQDKQKIIMKPYKELKPANLQKSKGEYQNYTMINDNPFEIMAFDIKNTGRNFKIPKSQVLAYDKKTKTMKIMKQNVQDFGIDCSDDIQDNTGYEYICQEYLYDDNLFAETYKSFIESSKVEIVIPGLVENIKLFQKYDLFFKAGESKDQEYVGNVKNSGEYILVGYTDKIIASRYYITKAVLARFNDNNS